MVYIKYRIHGLISATRYYAHIGYQAHASFRVLHLDNKRNLTGLSTRNNT